MKKLAMLVLLVAIPAHAQRLKGFADMHTHPMSHLGLGGMIMYGAPDEGSLMLKGQRYRGWHFGEKNCWLVDSPAGSIEAALGFDNAVHGGPGFGTTTFGDANNCGDVVRTAIIDKIEKIYIHEFLNPGLAPGLSNIHDHPHGGYPAFTHWPHWSSVTHQQMWWQWIKRSFDGGQRVMVALAVNNSLLAKAVNATQFVDDKSSVELQLKEIKLLVGRHADFMEIARTPADLRRIVQGNRMAVILGVETDDLGNLSRRKHFGGELITSEEVHAEIRNLFAFGVRYILPIHFSNSVLGGYTIQNPLFALSSKEYTNDFAVPRETCGEGIHFELTQQPFSEPERVLLRSRGLGRIIDTQPTYTPPRAGCGHRNSLDLTPLGESAIRAMMNLGMMIDIDHMSRLAVEDTLAIAEARNYPINSGHNGPLGRNCISGVGGSELQSCTEHQRTTAQYEHIRRLGGMVGLGHGNKATAFVRIYRAILEIMGNRPIAIGTDANGFEPLPMPDPEAPVRYGASFPMYQFGETSPGVPRDWDFNVVGFAHYGMFPDYIRSWQPSEDPAIRRTENPDTRMTVRSMDAFMSSAEGFARAWEKSVLRARGFPAHLARTLTTGWCTHPGAVIHTGDFNGDGSNDLLCRDASRIAIDLANPTVRLPLAGLTDLTRDTNWCTHAGVRFFGLGDFNGDGRTDLICKDANRIWVNTADPNGNFSAGGSFYQDTAWCTHAGIRFFGLGDFNGDGRTDLICKDANRIWVNTADTEGHFSTAPGGSFVQDTVWCTHAGIRSFELGDFNGDGRTDLICKDATRIWVNTANADGKFSAGGSFVQDTAWCTHAGIRSFELGDFNGDGRTDLMCKDANRIWVNTADAGGRFSVAPGGSFVQDTAWCTGAAATLRLTDVNGDGRTDLLCRDGRTLGVAYTNGDGRFTLP